MESRWNAAVEHRERLLRLALSRGMTPEDARDVVQEALLRCAEFEDLDVERIGAFLTSVTVRLCADVHRRNEEPVKARRWLAPLLHHEPDPADLVCRDHGPEWVASLMSRLPERQRHVLADKARGLTIQQIARRHRLTYKAAESALSRARASLRAAVVSSMSVAAVFARRARPETAPVTASVAAIAVGAVVLASPPPAPPPARPRVVAAGLGPESWGRPEAPRGAVVTPLPSPVPVVRDAARSSLASAPEATPRPDPLPTLAIRQGPLLVERQGNPYTPVERLGHCVEHGVSLYPVIRCNYPSPGADS